MKSEMATKLKELLDKMSQEEFDQKWATVEAFSLKGPSADEVLFSIRRASVKSSISLPPKD